MEYEKSIKIETLSSLRDNITLLQEQGVKELVESKDFESIQVLQVRIRVYQEIVDDINETITKIKKQDEDEDDEQSQSQRSFAGI